MELAFYYADTGNQESVTVNGDLGLAELQAVGATYEDANHHVEFWVVENRWRWSAERHKRRTDIGYDRRIWQRNHCYAGGVHAGIPGAMGEQRDLRG